MLVTPRGELGEDGGLAPAAELRLLNSSSLRGDQVFPAHQRISSIDLPIALSGGTVTDYPFDSYQVSVQFAAAQGGVQVPVLLTVDKVDSLFAYSIIGADGSSGLVWPAFGFMAATLFALAGFRNLAPGLPPIGSLLDYAAFLWAEVIIALNVVVSVVSGAVTEHGQRKI
ncbi:DUF4436 family protein [Amycolatopsis sp.]|uniref:DUF4436 family protein n=1 Tax=Amycolatopsis sp. TaxID=37632 RepID=UPI002E0B495A|nr:DUF4436 family protein [Amycolatopsis sp.]